MDRSSIIKLALAVLIGGGIGALMGYYGKCSSGTCPLTATPLRGAIYGAILGLLFGISFAHRSRPVSEVSTANPAILGIATPDGLQSEVLAADKPALVDFYSDSCPPCRMLAPTIDELATEYEGRALVCKVDIDQSTELAKTYNIQAIPTVVFFAEGKEMERVSGVQSKAAYAKILDHYINADGNEK